MKRNPAKPKLFAEGRKMTAPIYFESLTPAYLSRTIANIEYHKAMPRAWINKQDNRRAGR